MAVGVPDESRELSARGIADVEALGRRLGAIGWSPALVAASPLLRAQETARRILHEAGVATPITTLRELDPSRGSPDSVLEALAEHPPAVHVVLVGHQPLLGMLAHRLTGSEVPFSPATLAVLEGPALPVRSLFRLVLVQPPGR